MARSVPAIAILLAAGAFLTPLPAAGYHEYSGEPVTIENQQLDDLTISNAPGVTLKNLTINRFLKITDSGTVQVQNVFVGSTYDLKGIRGLQDVNVTVTGAFRMEDIRQAVFIQDHYIQPVYVYTADNVTFHNDAFESTICKDAASTNVNVVNPSPGTMTVGVCPPLPTPPAPPPDVTATPAPTPTPNATLPGANVTLGSGLPPVASGYNYQFELVGRTLQQNVWIQSAQSVVIRDSTIYGNLGIAGSRNVVLERVKVSGQLVLDHSRDVRANGVEVGSVLGLAFVDHFDLAAVRGRSDFACYRCDEGVLRDLRVAGRVLVVESGSVQRQDVADAAPVAPLPPPPPSPRPESVALNVSRDQLAFTHRRHLPDVGAADLLLEVAADDVATRLHGAAADDPGRAAFDLTQRFEKLVEFEDLDRDGGYGLTDAFVREARLAELPVSAIRQERLGEGRDGWRAQVDYALPQGGTLRLVFTSTDDDADRTKVDVEITGYAYATPTSRLALQARVAGEGPWTYDDANVDEDRVVFLGPGYGGYFAWAPTVMADGAAAPVAAHLLEDHPDAADGVREVVVFLSYPRAARLVHDPALGILDSAVLPSLLAPPLGNLLVYGSTLAAVLAVLWALGQTGRRRAA